MGLARHILVAIAAASIWTAGPVTAADRTAAEWSEAAIDDLHFIRASLRENHPGPLDQSNPGFRDWYERGFGEAIAHARRAADRAGYFFSIQSYLAGFQDSHLGALYDDPLEPGIGLSRRWPGFILGLQGEDFRIVESGDGGPPVGSRLVGCDGQSAQALANERLAPFHRLWSVRGTRPRTAPFLLIDEGNPFVRQLARCSFADANEREITVELRWAPIDNAAFAARVRGAQGRAETATGIRRFGRRGWWISLSTFDANSDEAAAPLLEVIRRMEAEPAALRDADIIVFDVRGNTGGNSEFGTRIAGALWGEAFLLGLPRATAIDWRVSPTNVRMVERTNLPTIRARFGDDAPPTRAYAELAAALGAALARGERIHREPLAQPAPGGAAAPVRARVFLLTDGWCGSACLDFADAVLAAPGVRHVGAETGADTIYIDNTAARLPSGEGLLGWSMKVYRGRPRGHNQSHVPAHPWQGSMADTAGLERWITSLAARTRR